MFEHPPRPGEEPAPRIPDESERAALSELAEGDAGIDSGLGHPEPSGAEAESPVEEVPAPPELSAGLDEGERQELRRLRESEVGDRTPESPASRDTVFQEVDLDHVKVLWMEMEAIARERYELNREWLLWENGEELAKRKDSYKIPENTKRYAECLELVEQASTMNNYARSSDVGFLTRLMARFTAFQLKTRSEAVLKTVDPDVPHDLGSSEAVRYYRNNPYHPKVVKKERFEQLDARARLLADELKELGMPKTDPDYESQYKVYVY